MIENPPQLRQLVDDLAASTWTLAAIGALFDSGLADQLKEPRRLDDLAARCALLPRQRIARILAVAAQRGVVVAEGESWRLAPGALPFLAPPMRAVLQGEYRSGLLQPPAYLEAARRPAATGWSYTDPVILQAQGDTSAGFARAFRAQIVGELGDLAGRLDRPGARFLDVGVGVGSLSIAMCRELPRLRAVGVDLAEVPLALARDNVGRADLADRIELRHLAVQDLDEVDAFDLAWLPLCFLGDHAEASCARVHAGLRPGGWVLSPAIARDAEPAERAVWSLVLEAYGGPVLDDAETEAMLRRAGFAATRTFGGMGWVALVAAQR
jgi:hypothetical protein